MFSQYYWTLQVARLFLIGGDAFALGTRLVRTQEESCRQSRWSKLALVSVLSQLKKTLWLKHPVSCVVNIRYMYYRNRRISGHKFESLCCGGLPVASLSFSKYMYVKCIGWECGSGNSPIVLQAALNSYTLKLRIPALFVPYIVRARLLKLRSFI